MAKEMRLLIADDHELLRDTLRSFLEAEPDIDIVTVADLSAARAAMDTTQPFDLVLLDYSMPGMNGLDGLLSLQDYPDSPGLVIFSGVAQRDVALRALQMGARGFLNKSMPAKSLLRALRFMAEGERFVPVDLFLDVPPAQPGAAAPADLTLTDREQDVLKALCRGFTNKEIARHLGLKEPTVKLHVKTLYRRLGATNRTQAAMLASNYGLV